MSQTLIQKRLQELEHADAGIRCNAVMELGIAAAAGRETSTIIPALIEKLKDADARVQRAANGILELTGLPAVPFLKKAARQKENAAIKQQLREIIRSIQEKTRGEQAEFGVRDEAALRHLSDERRFERTAFSTRPTKLRDERLWTQDCKPARQQNAGLAALNKL